eukprot:2381326-Alexandrium_andersonii.AAC.1
MEPPPCPQRSIDNWWTEDEWNQWKKEQEEWRNRMETNMARGDTRLKEHKEQQCLSLIHISEPTRLALI